MRTIPWKFHLRWGLCVRGLQRIFGFLAFLIVMLNSFLLRRFENNHIPYVKLRTPYGCNRLLFCRQLRWNLVSVIMVHHLWNLFQTYRGFLQNLLYKIIHQRTSLITIIQTLPKVLVQVRWNLTDSYIGFNV